ncbi:MAG: ATP-binding protein [Candidatus Margulisiibacteriota bacterium]
MIKRKISEKVLEYSSKFPVVTITGPRQSGKTTLSRMLFPDKPYVSLEELDERTKAIKDPRGFLSQFPDGAILDEAQRAPDLFSYIQTIVDSENWRGLFIITGSQQFEMLSHISQSLAGRTAIVKLLPFSLNEAYSGIAGLNIDNVLYTGFLPRIFDKQINPSDMASFYINTYLERDIRQLVNVRDLSKFEVFLKICAGRTGQLVNLSSLGNECDVNHNTIKAWLSILEASYILKLQRPYYRNINKRLVKSPKLYFLDTGLAANLVGIRSPEQVSNHPLKGALFETLIVSELLKNNFNRGLPDNIFFYRDHKGNEIDVILDNGFDLDLIEIKLGQTVHDDFFKGFKAFPEIKDHTYKKQIIFGGEKNSKYKDINIYSWRRIPSL